MSLVINHNTSALNTHRVLSVTDGSLAKSIEKLASGYQINTGADDPSGLTISEQLRSQISGLTRAVRNTSEANNVMDIAGGGLNEMNSILKKMRALAIHAANDGVTSPEQTAADQLELDSGLETIERIAATTRYSDQNLLNGGKQIVFSVNTEVNEPTDHGLLDTELTRVDQVFKRSAKVGISFTGALDKNQANTRASAQRAYFEADNAWPQCEIDGGRTTTRQEFTITGSMGARLFQYDKNTHLGIMARDINNARYSTGVGATLTFSSDMRAVRTSGGIDGDGPDYVTGTPADPVTGLASGEYVYRPGDAQIYGAGLNNPETATISSYCITPEAGNAFRVGYNCDGDGRIYAKVVDKSTNSIEYYKDQECTMLIGKGGADTFAPANASGIPGTPTHNLDGIYLTLTDKAENLDVYSIAVVGQPITEERDVEVTGLPGWCDPETFTMSGVNLGQNTSATGDLYFRYMPETFSDDGSVATFRVEAFKDSQMLPKDLVATSGKMPANVNPELAGGKGGGQTVRLESVTMANGQDSGLNITLNMPMPPYEATTSNLDMPTGESVGGLSFTNLGLRIYSMEYGSAETVRVENQAGRLFYQYRESDTLEREMLKEKTTTVAFGQDATIAVNGSEVITTGLKANLTTQDFSGELVFNAGRLGKTTLAVAGYEEGKIYSRATTLQGVPEFDDVIAAGDGKKRLEDLVVTLPLINSVGDGFRDVNGDPVTLTFDLTNMPAEFWDQFPTGVDGGIRARWWDQGNPKLCIELRIPEDGSGGTRHYDYPFNVNQLEAGVTLGATTPYPGLRLETDKLISIPDSTYNYNTGNMPWAPLRLREGGGDPLLEVSTNATHPRGNTSEVVQDFQGGMQLQLGGTENDHDRTIYSVPSMSPINLGRITENGVSYTLIDLMGGGVASLERDPALAMRILSRAVDDVSGLRARLGAFQSNMLQTNMNNLGVTTENLVKSESAIRDTDMASETSNFTRWQIMSQAGTGMLAQANQASQNVLSLLQ